MNTEQQQLDTLSRSKEAMERARRYHQRLVEHADVISADIVGRRQSAMFDGATEDLATRRSEHRSVIRQSDLAADALANAKAEHARHLADFHVMMGDDGEARAKLAHAHAVRSEAQEAVDAAATVLGRARDHLVVVEGMLRTAQDHEAERDRDAVARLHAALQDGVQPTSCDDAGERTSAAIDEDLRAGRLTVEMLEGKHKEAVTRLLAVDQDVSAAIDGVLLAEADRVARELEATETRAAMLRRRLVTFTERRPSGYVAPTPAPLARTQHPGGWFVPSPEEMAETLRSPPSLKQSDLIRRLVAMPAPERNGPWAENWRQEADGWTAFATALTDTATAEPAFAIKPAFVPSVVRPVSSIAPPSSALPSIGAANLAARDRRPVQQGRFVA